MVRRLHHCTSCRGRFVSRSPTQRWCLTCSNNEKKERRCSDPLASISCHNAVVDTPQQPPQPTATKRPRLSLPLPGHVEVQVPLSTTEASSIFVSMPEASSSELISDTGETKSNIGSTSTSNGTVTNKTENDSPALADIDAVVEEPLIVEIDDDSDDERSGTSEGFDDVHCTQIIVHGDYNDDYFDDDNDDDDNDPTTTTSASMPPPLPTAPANSTATNNNNSTTNSNNSKKKTPQPGDDVCLICGSSWERITSGLKGRINHIKRCAKKYGVQAKDICMRIEEEEEVEDDENDEEDKKPAAVTTNNNTNISIQNPYKKTPTWHAGAEQDLQMATSITITPSNSSTATTAASITTTTNSKQPSTTKQTSLTSYFKAPLRSLNKVLLANAKNANKKAKIQQQAKQNNTNTNNKKRGRWKTRQDYAHKNCPAYKRITGTDFIVDGFFYAKASLSNNYFLSHFHSDHYGGIDKTWNAGIIYCSLPTANLVHERLGVSREYLHPLGLNTPTVLESQGRPVTVTLMDANHCPGAVLMLFQIGNSKTILHVGDFRWNRDLMLAQNPALRALAMPQSQSSSSSSSQKPPQLDELFLDTTYCKEEFSLPSQQQAIDATVAKAVQEVQQAKANKERLLLLFGAYTIGKERIYLAVAERLGIKVYVNSQRYKILAALEWPPERLALLTTRKEESNLWVVELGHINMKRLPPYIYGLSQAKHPVAKFDRVVGFRPTGWTNSKRPGASILTTAKSGQLTVHSVPYSEHSSFPELVDCIRTLKPKKIIPTVTVSKSQQQVELLLRHVRMRQSTLMLAG